MSVCPEKPGEPLYIARVSSMWEIDRDKLFHATWFSRGSETVLGETSDPSELFLADTCGDAQLESITDTVHVSVCVSNVLHGCVLRVTCTCCNIELGQILPSTK